MLQRAARQLRQRRMTLPPALHRRASATARATRYRRGPLQRPVPQHPIRHRLRVPVQDLRHRMVVRPHAARLSASAVIARSARQGLYRRRSVNDGADAPNRSHATSPIHAMPARPARALVHHPLVHLLRRLAVMAHIRDLARKPRPLFLRDCPLVELSSGRHHRRMHRPPARIPEILEHVLAQVPGDKIQIRVRSPTRLSNRCGIASCTHVTNTTPGGYAVPRFPPRVVDLHHQVGPELRHRARATGL